MSCRVQNFPLLSLILILAFSFQGSAFESAALQAGYSQMYNLQFKKAHATFQEYETEHPNDSMGPVSDAAAYLFSEFNRLGVLQSQFLTDTHQILNSQPLHEDPVAARNFDAALNRTDKLVASALRKSPYDPNALLAQTLRFGLHADYLALIQKHEFAALKEIKQGRETAQLLLSKSPDNQDANIATGVENYLLSQKPAPVRWILRATGSQTNREAGIKELKMTASRGQYLAPYAKVLLAVAALRGGDKSEAKSLLLWLSEHYPGNPLYQTELAKLR